MTFQTRNFDLLTLLAPKFPNFATQILLFRLKHTVAVVTHAHVLQNFYTTWVLGIANLLAKKNNVQDQNWRGAGLGSIQKNWDPLRIFATVEASNFKFGTQIGFGTSLPKNDVQDSNWRGSGLGEHPKNWDPLRIFATIEASNFKFGTQLGFGTSLPKNSVLDQNWRGSRLGEHRKNLGPLRISATVETNKFKCGTQIGFGNSLAKNNI